MSSFYRNIPLLALAQAMMMSGMSLIIATSALVGYQLAEDKSFSTLPLAAIMIATMLTSIPAAFLMGRIGRKAGFIFAGLIAITGASLMGFGIIQHQFWLFFFASVLIGIFNGFGNYFRFTAADAVDAEHKSRAIAFVMAGGVVAAIIGPNLANFTQSLIPDAQFAGSYLALIVVYLLLMLFVFFLQLPNHNGLIDQSSANTARPLSTIMRQPKFIVAVVCGMLGYGVMSFVMTATPLAMQHHAHPFSDTAFVIQWHVLGMFAPSFVTGHLIRRFGVITIMAVGAVLGILCVVINLLGTSTSHFFLALLLLGVSWNFLFIGATTLLTETYTAAEKFKAQAANDFIVFTTVAIASLSAGVLHHMFGWRAVNYGVIPALVVIVLSLVWLTFKRTEAVLES